MCGYPQPKPREEIPLKLTDKELMALKELAMQELNQATEINMKKVTEKEEMTPRHKRMAEGKEIELKKGGKVKAEHKKKK